MKLHHFPPAKRARARAQVRSGGILCPSSAGQAAIRPTVVAAGLRAFDEKVGLPKFAHSLLASFHTVVASNYVSYTLRLLSNRGSA